VQLVNIYVVTEYGLGRYSIILRIRTFGCKCTQNTIALYTVTLLGDSEMRTSDHVTQVYFNRSRVLVLYINGDVVVRSATRACLWSAGVLVNPTEF